jgi:hypothetical protein
MPGVAGTEHRATRRFRDFVERYASLVPKYDRDEIYKLRSSLMPAHRSGVNDRLPASRMSSRSRRAAAVWVEAVRKDLRSGAVQRQVPDAVP